MSSTTRGKKVENDDFFKTPAWVVNAILPFLPTTGAVLDPCCGEGSILDVVQHGRPTYGIELDEERASTARVIHIVATGNALYLPWPKEARVIIQNPPFSKAEEFVREGIKHVYADMPGDELPIIRRAEEANRACAVLLRLAFLESKKRIAFHREFPADVYPLAHRPSFTGNGKHDSCAYAWFVWGPGRGGRIKVLDDAPPNVRHRTPKPKVAA
jgi:hypothetical protein